MNFSTGKNSYKIENYQTVVTEHESAKENVRVIGLIEDNLVKIRLNVNKVSINMDRDKQKRASLGLGDKEGKDRDTERPS
jgi:hypothetical protein